MRNRRFHGLKRLVRIYFVFHMIRSSKKLKAPQKIRQTWNKYNLYNLSRAETPPTASRTFFQQKWSAKALTRAYHGETIREKHWQKMFRPTIRSVVPMDHRKFADPSEEDGAKYAKGRGSGLEVPPEKKPNPFPKTPYMNMLYAPAERRLDTAIFRAMFASSTRQARQFVVHGNVKVNGKKVIKPQGNLNSQTSLIPCFSKDDLPRLPAQPW